MKIGQYLRTAVTVSMFSIGWMFMPLNGKPAVIKGIVLDGLANEGIPFATIRIFSEKDTISPVTMFVTDLDGTFSETIDKCGDLQLRIQSMGKKDVRNAFSIRSDETLDFGIIQMDDDVSLIRELEVVAVRPIVKAEADKLTYAVEDDSDAKTYTLLEMLRKVPMVRVDGEDNISVNGSSSFQVYVNGRPSPTYSGNAGQIFKSMPASTVRSIEVITNPGARYDAEGAGGVLNLVMAGSPGNGDDSSYSAGAGVHIGTRGYDGNVNIAGKAGRLSFSGNALYNKITPGESEVVNSQSFSDRTFLTHTSGRPDMDFSNGNISVEYALNQRTAINLTGAVNRFGTDSRGASLSDVISSDESNPLGYSSTGEVNLEKLSVNGSLSVFHDFADKNSSSLSVIYQVQHDKNNTESKYDFTIGEDAEELIDLSDRNSSNLENTLDNTLQADFSTGPNSNVKLDTGLKFASRKSRSSSELVFPGLTQENQFTHYRNATEILATYIDYVFSANAISVKAGLRYEHTWQRVRYYISEEHGIYRNYGILVPSLSFGYRLPAGGSLGLTYNMRISRPGISYMNPFADRSDPTVLAYGNPNLKVEKTHNMGFSYNVFTPKLILNTRISYNYTSNGIEQYRYIADGMIYSTYGNVAKRNLLRMDASGVWSVSEKTRVVINASLGYAALHNEQMDMSNGGWQWNTVTGVQHTFPWDIKSSLYMIASSRTYSLEGWNSGFNMLTASLTKSFVNERLNVSMGFNTGLSKGGRMTIENHSHTAALNTMNIIRVPMLGVTIGISYAFGGYQSKPHAERKSVETDYIEQRSDMESISINGAGGR